MNNLSSMKARLTYHGGAEQQDRMIRDKRKTLDKVVLYSYQGAKVKQDNSQEIFKALINPNKLKPDYDDKVISIGYESNFTTGTVFDWVNTGTKWLIYLQDLTELAYFKGDIRRCRYSINWENENGEKCSIYAAIRGPVETKINFIQKNGISVDVPNHSLDIIMPLTEEALKYFKRYSKFYLQGLNECDDNICWRVEAKDSISTPGILEITAVEYYANEAEDDIENGIVGGLIAEPIKPDTSLDLIEGETFIKPKKTYAFIYKGNEDSNWYIDPKLPIKKTINDRTITIIWDKTYSGEFVLQYGTSKKTIVVESLF